MVWGLSISPGEIKFDLIKGEKGCEKMTLTNEQEINLNGRDSWTDNQQSVGILSEYIKSASELGIEINYQNYIQNMTNQEVEVCLTGNNPGNYYGALVYNSESFGGVSTGVGTWLMVDIKEENSANIGGNIGGSSSGGGASLTKTNNKSVGEAKILIDVDKQEKVISKENQDLKNSGLTGAVIGANKNTKIGAIVVLFAIILGVLFYNKLNKRERYV